MIKLRAGQQLTDQIWTTLKDVQLDLVNAFSQSEIKGLTNWAALAENKLRLVVTRSELDRLVLTPRLVAIASTSAVSVQLLQMAISELTDAVDRWNMEINELEAWRQRWIAADYLVAPDTNVYMHWRELFNEVDWHAVAKIPAMEDLHVVIPMQIVDELDNLKQRAPTAEAKTQARKTMAKMANLFADSSQSPTRRIHPPTDDHGSVTLEVLADPIGHERLSIADDEIVSRLVALQALSSRKVRVVTYDFGMAFRARQNGLEVIHLE
jgi:rRNA-processing protein FCF1